MDGFRVKLKVIVYVRNAETRRYKEKNTSKVFPSIQFARTVELPTEPKQGDRIDVEPTGFKWNGKTISLIEDTYPKGKPFFEAIDASKTLEKDIGTLKESLLFLIKAYEDNGWKAEIPELWQEIIDEPDD